MDSMNPVAKIKDGVEYPPFLLIHGDKDELVPYYHAKKLWKTAKMKTARL